MQRSMTTKSTASFSGYFMPTIWSRSPKKSKNRLFNDSYRNSDVWAGRLHDPEGIKDWELESTPPTPPSDRNGCLKWFCVADCAYFMVMICYSVPVLVRVACPSPIWRQIESISHTYSRTREPLGNRNIVKLARSELFTFPCASYWACKELISYSWRLVGCVADKLTHLCKTSKWSSNSNHARS